MSSGKKVAPDFFDESPLDPVTSAVGPGKKSEPATPQPKKKAGFYLSQALLDRFNRKFHELKLAGVPVENKSALIELAITFTLRKLDQLDADQTADFFKKLTASN